MVEKEISKPLFSNCRGVVLEEKEPIPIKGTEHEFNPLFSNCQGVHVNLKPMFWNARGVVVRDTTKEVIDDLKREPRGTVVYSKTGRIDENILLSGKR